MEHARSHAEWFRAVSNCDEHNPLFTLRPWFRHSLPDESPFTAPATMRRLEEIAQPQRQQQQEQPAVALRGTALAGAAVLSESADGGEGNGHTAPPLSDVAIETHIAWLRATGLLPVPTGRRTTK